MAQPLIEELFCGFPKHINNDNAIYAPMDVDRPCFHNELFVVFPI